MTEGRLRTYQAASKILDILVDNNAISENRRLTYQEVYALRGIDQELYEAAYIYLRRSGYVMAPISESEMWVGKEGLRYQMDEQLRRMLHTTQIAMERQTRNLFKRALQPTPPSSNAIYNYGNMSSPLIQQGTTSSSQTASFSSEEITDLFQLLEDVKSAIPKMALSDSDSSEAAIAIIDIKEQLRSSQPNGRFLRSCFASIKRICESAAGGAIASGLLQRIAEVIAALDKIQ